MQDARYSVPTMLFVSAGSVERAREIALGKLEESAHHLAVEVWADEVEVFTLAARSKPEPRE